MGEGDGFGGNETDGTGGPAGPGPSEGAESDSDYGGGLGISLGDVGSGVSDLGSMLSSLPLQTDLSDIMDPGMFTEGLSQNIGFNLGMDQESLLDSIWGKLGLPKGIQNVLSLAMKANPLTSQMQSMMGIKGGKGMAQTGLTSLAGMFAGPLGALGMGLANKGGLTDSITSAFGNTVGNGGQSVGSPTGGGEMDMSSILSGLGGIYSGYKGMKSAGDMLGGLQGLYSQNSPYAQQLRQQLARQDAAGGRRSQYGPREVELQARLAQMASNQIPAMSQLSQQQQIARAQMLKNGIGAFEALGGLKGLQSLFGNGPSLSMPEFTSNVDLGNIFGLGGVDQGFDPNSVDWGF